MQILFNFYTCKIVKNVMESPEIDLQALKETMTVVVPIYNRAGLIARCLDSIYAQTYRPINIILVDNASSDSSADVAGRWFDLHNSADFSGRIISEPRRGAAFARSTGLEHTMTEKVMFFDSDDTMRPECITSAMEAWRKNPDASIVAWPTAYHYPGLTRITHSISGNLPERHLVHSILRTLGYAVKTEYIRKIGGWKGEFATWDDFELGVRLLLPNPGVIGLKSPMADVYPQEESITGTDYSSKSGKWEHSLNAISDYIRKSGRRDSRRLLNIVNYRRAILAADYAKEGRSDLARSLLKEALKKTPASGKPAIWFAYHFTRLGFRGAFRLVGRLL